MNRYSLIELLPNEMIDLRDMEFRFLLACLHLDNSKTELTENSPVILGWRRSSQGDVFFRSVKYQGSCDHLKMSEATSFVSLQIRI